MLEPLSARILEKTDVILFYFIIYISQGHWLIIMAQAPGSTVCETDSKQTMSTRMMWLIYVYNSFWTKVEHYSTEE